MNRAQSLSSGHTKSRLLVSDVALDLGGCASFDGTISQPNQKMTEAAIKFVGARYVSPSSQPSSRRSLVSCFPILPSRLPVTYPPSLQLETAQKAVQEISTISRCSLHRIQLLIMDSEFDWLHYPTKPRIKEEGSDANILPSPSTAPSSLSVTSSSSRRGSSTGPSRRQRPYPSLSDSRRPHSEMSSNSSHPYGTWSGIRSGSGRSQRPPLERPSSDGEHSAYPGSMNSYMNVSHPILSILVFSLTVCARALGIVYGQHDRGSG